MKEYIDDLLKQLPNGNYKTYLAGHRAKFVDFLCLKFQALLKTFLLSEKNY